MSKDQDDELNKGGPDGEAFSLEEILAEFGGGRSKKKAPADLGDTIPFPVIQSTKRRTENRPPVRRAGKVVAFPGSPEGDVPAPPASPPPVQDPPEKEKVVEFPGEEGPASDNPIAEKLNRLIQKADRYAAHMFEEEGVEDAEEVRRAERYIPGTDLEDPPAGGWRERRPRRPPPVAPDLPPGELARRYQKGLKGLRLRTVLVFLLALPLLYLSLSAALGLPLPPALAGDPRLRLYGMAALQAAAMLAGVDILLQGFFGLFRLQMGMDTLLVFSCAAALADTCTMLDLNSREGQLPYCAAAVLALGFAMRGAYLKRQGQRLACRTAASTSEPYLVTLDEGRWNGRDTYEKWAGEAIGFGRQMQAADGAQRIFYVACPLLFTACVVLSVVASVGRGRPENLLWCLSATLASVTAFSGGLCFGMPWNSLSLRLSRSGAALAGWDGVAGTGRGNGILLTDTDLFPPGCVSLNGIKVFGDFPVDKVVSYTATLIRDVGGGLDRCFHDLLRTQGTVYRRASDFSCHEGGGASAEIRGDQVLVGSAAFMHLMEISLPQGLNVKNAVFCAINGELAGIFALKYTLHGAVEPALHALIRNRVTPVLATRDFNLIPAMLHQRFKLPVDKMDFPAVERRLELSDEDQEHSAILSAVLCREGLGPYSEAVVGGRRLRRVVRTSAGLACAGAAIGVLLAFYLTYLEAYASLSASNLLVFLAMWLVPAPLLSGWVNKF